MRLSLRRWWLLLQFGLGLAQVLDGAAALLGLEPALARAGGRLGGPAGEGRHGRPSDQFDQAVERVLAVALLGAVALRGDHQHALARQSPAGQPFKPSAHIVGQALRAAHVEAKLHRARELVDILPTRSRGADEPLLELALVDADALVYSNHSIVISRPRPRSIAGGPI